MQYKGQTETLHMLVVGGSGPSLLGRNWLQKLKLDWQEIWRIQPGKTLKQIPDRHKAVFKDELGELKGSQAKIYVNPEAQPHFHKARPVPFALKIKVEQELERLERESSRPFNSLNGLHQ